MTRPIREGKGVGTIRMRRGDSRDFQPGSPAFVDAFQKPCENEFMKTVENTTIPADALADLEHALHLQATGQRDPGFEKRLGEQTEKIRQEIVAAHGVLNVAVDLVREGRDEE